jgi:hypothetical protein
MSTIHPAPATAVIEDKVSTTVATTAWGAILAGGVAAVAVSFFMLALGAGIGFSVVSPWAAEGISASSLSIGSGIYMVVVAMVASTIGGYLTGRLRSRWVGVHPDEVYFRDTAHGFMAWAFATVLSASLLGAATTHILAGATAGSIPAAGAAASQAASPTDAYVDALLRADPAAQGSTADSAAIRSEFGRLMANALRKGGDISAADRTYMAKVVAVRTGLSQAEAEQRVNQAITDAKAAADSARKAAAKLSFWLAASLLAGAFAASLAATEGGELRDSRWYEPGWRKGQARI